MLRQQQIEREFKANDHMAINASNREMERQGYEVFSTRHFLRKNTTKRMTIGLLNPGLAMIVGNDKWVKITYRLKFGQNR